jgi:hypothetical protein
VFEQFVKRRFYLALYRTGPYAEERSSLCRPQDSDNFCFPDLLRFWPFCASFSDNLVTLDGLDLSRLSQAQLPGNA